MPFLRDTVFVYLLFDPLVSSPVPRNVDVQLKSPQHNVIKLSLKFSFISYACESNEAVSSAILIPVIGYKDLPYIPPSLELRPEIRFCYVFLEPRKIKRCDSILIPPIVMMMPVELPKIVVALVRFGILSQSLPFPLFSFPSNHCGPSVLTLSLTLSHSLSLSLSLSRSFCSGHIA